MMNFGLRTQAMAAGLGPSGGRSGVAPTVATPQGPNLGSSPVSAAVPSGSGATQVLTAWGAIVVALIFAYFLLHPVDSIDLGS